MCHSCGPGCGVYLWLTLPHMDFKMMFIIVTSTLNPGSLHPRKLCYRKRLRGVLPRECVLLDPAMQVDGAFAGFKFRVQVLGFVVYCARFKAQGMPWVSAWSRSYFPSPGDEPRTPFLQGCHHSLSYLC